LNILLTGAGGQLGSELLPLLTARGNVIATDLAVPPVSSTRWVKLDITDTTKLEALLNQVRPDLIVNTAAFTAVDLAETETEISFALNAALPEHLAHWANLNDAHLMHYSTDYIFNGKATAPYLETDSPDPKSVYGASKLEGERVIQSSGCRHAILRTSWVYSSHGKNFVLSMLELARKGLSLSVVDDQQGCPTWARNLALASDSVIESWRASGSDCPDGVFHYCDDQTLSWYDFAGSIFRFAVAAGLLDKEPDLTPVPGSGFPQPAERPKWSVLDTRRITDVFNIQSVSFGQSLQAVIDEIANKTETPSNATTTTRA
jgi:dTDP-4-dehydrorhamnose reductase